MKESEGTPGTAENPGVDLRLVPSRGPVDDPAFGYRRATKPPPPRGGGSQLDDIRPSRWPPAYTTDLLEPLTTVAELTASGVLPVCLIPLEADPCSRKRRRRAANRVLGCRRALSIGHHHRKGRDL